MRRRKPNDPPPKDPFFGGSFDYIEGSEASKHKRRGHRLRYEEGGREKHRRPLATIAKERRNQRESHAISSEAIAENHRKQTRRAATRPPVPLSGDRDAPSGHGRDESDTGSYVRERTAPSEHGRGKRRVTFGEPSAPIRSGHGQNDISSYGRERPAPNEYGRGEKHVTFRERESDIGPAPSEHDRGERVVTYREPSAPSRHGHGENRTGSYGRERPAPIKHGRGQRHVTFRERESDIGHYFRERPALSEHGYGERVVSLKERPAPSRYGYSESDIVYNVKEQPAPSRHGHGGNDIDYYVRERPAPGKHGRGESDIVTYIIERPAAEQPQRPDAHQMAEDREFSPNVGRGSRRPAWRGPSAVRRKPAPPETNQLERNPKSSTTPWQDSKPKKAPNQDNRGHVQPKQRVYKRVVDSPSLAGFSGWVSPPYSCSTSTDSPPLRGKYEMSGALDPAPPAKRRGRSPTKRERLASNDDIVRNVPQPRNKYEMSGALGSPTPLNRRSRLLAKSVPLATDDDIVRHNPPPRSNYDMSGALQSPERRPRSPTKPERSGRNDDIVRHNSPPRTKYLMSGALGSSPPEKMRRPRSPEAQREQLAYNDDIVHNIPPPRGKHENVIRTIESQPSVEIMRRPRSPKKRVCNCDIIRNRHRGDRHSSVSSNSSGTTSNGSAPRRRGHIIQINQNLNVVLNGRRVRGYPGKKGGLNVKVVKD